MAKKNETSYRLDEIIRDHARTQLRAARARFKPAGPSLEKPRDVTVQFLEEFARAMSTSVGGVKLVPSRREVRIVRDDLSYRYVFQASTNNTAGVTIRL